MHHNHTLVYLTRCLLMLGDFIACTKSDTAMEDNAAGSLPRRRSTPGIPGKPEETSLMY